MFNAPIASTSSGRKTRPSTKDRPRGKLKERLDQLALQARGLPAFEDVAVLNALKLTPEQALAVEEASKKITQKRQEFLKEIGKAKVDLQKESERWNRQEGELNREAVAGLVAVTVAPGMGALPDRTLPSSVKPEDSVEFGEIEFEDLLSPD